MLIHQAAVAAARRYPDRVALVGADGRQIGYRDLLRRTGALARMLRVRTRPGDRVAVLSHKTPDTVLAMLATLRAGRCYVPIDPSVPLARRAFILDQAGCALLLAGPTAHLDGISVPVLDPGEEFSGPGGDPVHAGAGIDAKAGVDGGLDDEAYVLYTSGSTGEPKGVVITHRNALAFVRWAARAFPLGPDDQVAVHAPLHFDLPVYDLYVGLAGGATLHLVNERVALFPQGLYRFLRQRDITHLYAVPSALTALVNRSTLPADGLPALRQLLYAGEEFRPRALAALMAAVPGATVSNLYGPIETNVVTHWTLAGPPDRDRRVPLGRAVDGAVVALLAEDGTASERAAMEGEIVVAGDCVTPGYLARPDLTGRAMVRLTTEHGTQRFYRTGDFARRDGAGLLHLLGRRDGLVKTRGYRVELGEIEAALGGHPAVAEVAVFAAPDPEITHRLHAVVAPAVGLDRARPAGGTPIPPDGGGPADRLTEQLIAYCRQRLPGYMVPGQVHLVPELPRTSTGKIARAQLPQLITNRTGGPR